MPTKTVPKRAAKAGAAPKKKEPSIAELLKEFDDGRGYFDDKGLCPVLGLKLKEGFKPVHRSTSPAMQVVRITRLRK